MADTCVAAQLYTLRDYLKTPDEIAKTLTRVAAMGYRAVQLSALGPIGTSELKQILDGEGLTVCGTHTNFEQLRDNLDAVVEEHQLLGCRYTAIPIAPNEYRSGDGYRRFAREASEAAGRAKEQGLIVGYHNHSFELEKYDGKTGLEILFSESEPALTAEIDTYWIQHGGGDPAWWIRRVAGRSPLVHLKDMVIQEREQRMAEVGEGNLNWPAILEACREAGVEWYIVEQDHTYGRDPFQSLEISLRNLREMGLS